MLFAGCVLLCYSQESDEQIARKFRSFDRDKDGRHSREEVPESSRSQFEHVDTDKDGFVSLEEFRTFYASLNQFPPQTDHTTQVPEIQTTPPQFHVTKPAGEQKLTVHLFTAVRKRISDEEWRHIARNYSAVFTLFSPARAELSGENRRVKWVKSLNPDLLVLVYGSAINAANFPLNAQNPPREHQDWFLRDEAGEFVTDWEFRDAAHPDPGNLEWQNYVGSTLKDYIERYGYDGVFLDLTMATTKYVNFRKKYKAVNPKTGRPYTDADWKQATMNLLRILRQYIGDKILIINGEGEGMAYFRNRYSDFFKYADGMSCEGFTGWFGSETRLGYASEEGWKASVDTVVDCAERGKTFIAATSVGRREGLEKLYLYIGTSFLLGMGERHYLALRVHTENTGDSFDPATEKLAPFCKASLGRPLAKYYYNNRVYQRDFEFGKVLVNSKPAEVAITLDGIWKSMEGNAITFPLAMSPHSGCILLKDK